jgi:protein-S-isoprenylcysteine O-methyltransferase Ste14
MKELGVMLLGVGLIVAVFPAVLPEWVAWLGGVAFGVGFWLWLAGKYKAGEWPARPGSEDQ